MARQTNINSVDEFMITEYERIKDQLLYLKQAGHARATFLVTLISAVGAVLMVLYQVAGGRINNSFAAMATVSIVGLLILGVLVYVYLVKRDITTIEYLRALAKIRRYFVVLSKKEKNDISSYLFYVANDDQPPLTYGYTLIHSSLRSTIMVLNALLVGGGCYLFVWWQVETIEMDLTIFGLLLLIFLLTLVLQVLYVRHRFAKAETTLNAFVDFAAPHSSLKRRRL